MALACRAALRLSPAAAAAASRRLAALLLCRAASGTREDKTAEPAVTFAFERLADEPALFPELFQPGRQSVLLAVDPDLNGAVAALCWHNPRDATAAAAATNSSGSGSNGSTTYTSESTSSSITGGTCAPPPLHNVRVELFDMPVELWRYGSGRDKKHPDATGFIAILQRYAPGSLGAAGAGGAAAAPLAPAPPKQAKSKGGAAKKGRRRKRGADVEGEDAEAAETEQQQEQQQAGQQAAQQHDQQQHKYSPEQEQQQQHSPEQQQRQPPVVRAVVEYSTPQYISGKLSWYSLGFAMGLLNGLLAVAGIPYERVPATTWKRGMGLHRSGKEGSIALAGHLLPAAADLLKRKKDHGRAEALLLAAWGLGVRMRPIGGNGGSGAEDAAAGGEPEADGLEETEEG
ncbi:hypothetical protein ABPG75_007469 [Micractinium tetrahymenae]